MKNKKVIIIIITLLITAIAIAWAIVLYNVHLSTKQTNNMNVQNEVQEESKINNVQLSSNDENNLIENQTVIEPILNPITSGGSDNLQENESIVSKYYYSQLDETAKALYDGLKQNKENLISGNYTIDYGTQFNTLLNSEEGEQQFNQAFQSAWNAFSYDNIDLFYINVVKLTLINEYTSLGGIKTYQISVGPGNNNNYFQDTFKNQQEVENAKSYLENIKKQMIQQTASDDMYTKIEKVHNWLIYFANYENDATSKDQYTIYGTLKNGKAVCEGYARTFKYFMDAVGVPCVLASGTAKNSQGEIESHAWNYVQINDIWYAVDVTWDDPVVTGGEQTIEMQQKYFLKGSEEFFKDHTEEGKISEQSVTFKFPTLSNKDYTK